MGVNFVKIQNGNLIFKKLKLNNKGQITFNRSMQHGVQKISSRNMIV
jgi:hypothetical protein